MNNIDILFKSQHHGFELDIEPSVSISIIYIYCPHSISQEHYTLVQSQLTNIIIRLRFLKNNTETRAV